MPAPAPAATPCLSVTTRPSTPRCQARSLPSGPRLLPFWELLPKRRGNARSDSELPFHLNIVHGAGLKPFSLFLHMSPALHTHARTCLSRLFLFLHLFFCFFTCCFRPPQSNGLHVPLCLLTFSFFFLFLCLFCATSHREETNTTERAKASSAASTASARTSCQVQPPRPIKHPVPTSEQDVPQNPATEDGRDEKHGRIQMGRRGPVLRQQWIEVEGPRQEDTATSGCTWAVSSTKCDEVSPDKQQTLAVISTFLLTKSLYDVTMCAISSAVEAFFMSGWFVGPRTKSSHEGKSSKRWVLTNRGDSFFFAEGNGLGG